jgi:tripartite-type tricarboxylate transporter receptor subunit TctC
MGGARGAVATCQPPRARLSASQGGRKGGHYGLMRTAAALISGLLVLGATVAAAQGYPNRPIRLLTPEAGGGGDIAARVVASPLAASLGQPIVVENRGAASGVIAAQIVAKAAPDGHTMMFYGSAIWLLPLLQAGVPFDTFRDFRPITMVATAPSVLVVHPSVAANSVNELIALVKAKPGVLNYGSGATGGTPHLSAELFMHMTGTRMLRVDFKGTAAALNALFGGELQVLFPPAGTVTPHLKSGRLKAIAVASLGPSTLVPGLPTVAATLPGFEVSQKYAFFAPAKTPAPIINRLNQEVVRILNQPEVKGKLFSLGLEVVANSSQEATQMIKSETDRMGTVIKAAGIRGD